MRFCTVPLREILVFLSILPITLISQTTTDRTGTTPGTKSGAVEIGRTWNGYTCQGRESNQIAWDPFTSMLVVINRGDRTHAGSGELVMNISTDLGITWTTTPTINTGLGNDAGQLTARHPSVMLCNPEKSADVAKLRLAAIWCNLHSTPPRGFYEIPYLAGTFGSSYTKKKLNIPPPDLVPSNRITLAPATGAMYSLTEGVDSVTGWSIGEYYLLTSTDYGETWRAEIAHPFMTSPLADGYKVYSTMTLDASPDGMTVAAGFAAVLFDSVYSFVPTQNKLGYTVSTDGGATWSTPTLDPLSDWDFVNAAIDKSRAFFSTSLSLVMDNAANPHFLVTVQGDAAEPLDSTFIGEVTRNGDKWECFKLASINCPKQAKFLPTGQLSIYNEHEWAKSLDGTKIYAKWIDTDSLFVTAPAGYPTPLARDTMTDVFMTGRDVRSNPPTTRGWGDVVNVTGTPDVAEKFTKIAPFVGADMRVHLMYTVFDTVEYVPGHPIPDGDDYGEARLFYVPGITIDAPWIEIGVEDAPQPTAFTLAQNHPNPFNPSTTIDFTLREAGRATLTIHDMLGREVATVLDAVLERGPHSVTLNRSGLASGPHIYTLRSGADVLSRVMTVVK